MKNNFFLQGKILFTKKQNNILSAATVLMIMILASAVLGLIRDRLLAGWFFIQSNQWQLDVYFASFRIPDMLFQILILGSLSAAFIPVFTEYLVKDEKEAYNFSSLVLNSGLLIFIVMVSGAFIFARPLSQLITNLKDYQLDLMVNLLRILLFGQILFAISNFFTAILQSNQRFLLPAFAAFLYNLGVILGIIFFTPIFGIYGPVLGVILGIILHWLIQLPLVKNLGFKHNLRVNYQHPGIKKIGRLMLPRTISFAFDQLNLSITVFIATSLAVGSLSIYNFAQHLSGLPVSLFGLTIGQAALPILAKEANVNKENFRNLLVASLHQILFLALPAGIILLVLRIPAVRLAFGAKAFPWEATILTGKIVGILALSIFSQGIAELLMRAFYALQNTTTPLILKGISVVFNGVLSFVLVFTLKLGILGLALANSLTNVFYGLFLLVFLQKDLTTLYKKDVFVPIIKMVLITVLSGLALWGPMRLLDHYVLDTTRTIQLIALTIIVLIFGGSIYLLFAFLFKIDQLDNFIAVVKKFGQWRQVLSQSQEVLDEKQHS